MKQANSPLVNTATTSTQTYTHTHTHARTHTHTHTHTHSEGFKSALRPPLLLNMIREFHNMKGKNQNTLKRKNMEEIETTYGERNFKKIQLSVNISDC